MQVLRTRHHLLEARAPYYGKPAGRFYFCGDGRFRENYVRAEEIPEHAEVRRMLFEVIESLPPHIPPEHPYWRSREGRKWAEANRGLEKKQLYNHPDYAVYDEED